MKISLKKVFKHLSMMSMLLSMSLAISVLLQVMHKDEVVHVTFKEFIVLFGTGYLSYFYMYLKEKLMGQVNLKKAFKSVALILMRMVSIGAPIIGYWTLARGRWDVKLFTIGMVIWAIIRMSVWYEKNYTEILTFESYIIMAVIAIGTGFTSQKSVGMILFLLTTVLFFLISNQGGIDQLLVRTQKNTPMAEGIKKDNMKWLLVWMGMFLTLLIFKDAIVYILGIGGQGIINILAWLLSVICRQEAETKEPIVEEVINGEMPAFGEPTGNNGWIDALFFILVLVLVIWRRKQIIQGIRRLFIKIKMHIAMLVKWLMHRLFEVKESNQDERFYSDQVEHLEHIEIKRVSKNTALNKKKWRRDFKLFAKEMDMQVKYRKGYKLLLEVFKLKGVTFMDAQTPRERGSIIKDKVQIEIETETRNYEQVKYGYEPITDKELKALEEQLEAYAREM